MTKNTNTLGLHTFDLEKDSHGQTKGYHPVAVDDHSYFRKGLRELISHENEFQVVGDTDNRQGAGGQHLYLYPFRR